MKERRDAPSSGELLADAGRIAGVDEDDDDLPSSKLLDMAEKRVVYRPRGKSAHPTEQYTRHDDDDAAGGPGVLDGDGDDMDDLPTSPSDHGGLWFTLQRQRHGHTLHLRVTRRLLHQVTAWVIPGVWFAVVAGGAAFGLAGLTFLTVIGALWWYLPPPWGVP